MSRRNCTKLRAELKKKLRENKQWNKVSVNQPVLQGAYAASALFIRFLKTPLWSAATISKSSLY